MKVVKRNGNTQEISFDKVKHRIMSVCKDLKTIDPIIIAQQVISRIYDNVKTSELDELAAEICATMATENIHTTAPRLQSSAELEATPNSFIRAGLKILHA